MQIPNHTQVPNEIIDTMELFTPAEFKVLIAICRKTIGWHKTSDRISYSQLEEMTGLSRNGIAATTMGLTEKKIITRYKTKFGYRYDINYDIPLSSTDTIPVNSIGNIPVDSTDVPNNSMPIPLIDTTKDTNAKDTNTKKKKEKSVKHKYGEYKHVLLTNDQYNKLVEEMGKDATEYWIKKVDEGIEIKGYKYKNHYLVIKKWRGSNGSKINGFQNAGSGAAGNAGGSGEKVHQEGKGPKDLSTSAKEITIG